MPVVAVAPNNELLEKLKSNLHEVRARGGKLYRVRRSQGRHAQRGRRHRHRDAGACRPHCKHPIVFAIPLQLLAYHVAVLKGTDVDQPRNLAKSLTVE